MDIKEVEREEGINLKDLREFIEQCKDLPEDTMVLLDYSNLHSSYCTNIKGDEDSIVFYNW